MRRRRPFWYLRRPRPTVASEVDEELALHLELRAQELKSRGLSDAAARAEALRQFGDLEDTRRYCRTQDLTREALMHRMLTVDELLQDLKISIRSLLRAPLLALTIVATVGFGVGATAVIFGAVHAAFLRPLPYVGADRLFWVYTDAPPNRFRLSAADYLALDEQRTRFEAVAAYTGRTMAFSDGSVAEQVRAQEVTWTYFGVLGLSPMLGRDFVSMDSRTGRPPAAIASHSFWRRRLGGRADALGRFVRLDGRDYLLVGVLPETTGPFERLQDFFVVAQWNPPTRRGPFLYTTIAKLPPGGNRSAAAEELRRINRRIFPIWRASYQDERATWSMTGLQDLVTRRSAPIGAVALAAVALVWLIACANASNLLLARVTSRRRELAVRAALGASRWRVVRYLLVESLILAAAASVLGFALTSIGLDAMRQIGPEYFPRTQEIELAGPVLSVFAALSIAGVLIFGLVPALHGTGVPAEDTLRSSGRAGAGGAAARRLRQILVGGQFAVATPLLIIGALLLSTLHTLGEVDLGFDSRHVVGGAMSLPAAKYADDGGVEAFWGELRRRVASLPGVVGAAYSDGRPPDGVGNFNNFELETRPTPAEQSPPVCPWVSVSPEYFRLLGVRLLEGRFLDERDARREQLEAVVVDSAWARRFFPDESAVGKRFREGGCTECPWTTVVGVVSNVTYAGLDRPEEGAVYWPMPPATRARYLMVRTSDAPEAIVPSLSAVVRGLDPSLPLSDVATIDDLVARSLDRPRSLTVLVAAFAIVAILLSVIGIHGVMAYYVQQHTKDISIRMALGGSRGQILRLVLGQGMRIVLAGVALGLLASAAATRLLGSLLFGVAPLDPGTFTAATALLLLAALVACYAPARLATAQEPASALRDP